MKKVFTKMVPISSDWIFELVTHAMLVSRLVMRGLGSYIRRFHPANTYPSNLLQSINNIKKRRTKCQLVLLFP